jgi:hypothetical protein
VGLGTVAALVTIMAVGCGATASPTANRPANPTVPTTASPSSGATTGATAAPPPTTATPPTTTPRASTAPSPAPTKLGPGATGPAVAALQSRLTSLGYWVGPSNGNFGDSTEQAVYALQKAAGLSRDGIVGPQTAAALAGGARPRPRSTSGYVVEVDLQDDLILFVTNGKLDYVLNTSTGGGYHYSVGGVTALAETPEGYFHIYRQVDGMVTDSLGQLWRPKFFTGGFAIHGDSYVPAYPASHGCARVSNEAIDWIWAENLAPVGTAVWVY